MPDNIKENAGSPAETPAARAAGNNGQPHKNHHHNHNHGKNRPPREKGAQEGPIDTDAALAEAKARIRAEAAGSEINNRPAKVQNEQQNRRPQNRQEKQNNQGNRSNRQGGERRGQNPGGSNRQNNPRNQQNRRDKGRGRDARETAQEQELNDRLSPLNSADSYGESFLSSRDDFNFGISKTDDAILDAMPPDPTLDAVFSDVTVEETPKEGTEIVGIHFPQGGKVYYFDPAGNRFEKGSFAIVETARGQELGEVAIANCIVANEDIVQPLKPVIRAASKDDLEHNELNVRREKDAMVLCRQKIEAHKLDMKLTGAQYTFDNAKLIFYFTAAQRVDFRELVKDLATTFHTRIELRQIGTRDEAKMLGGIGACGRRLCCSCFLPNYAQASIKMAKHQGLAMNSSKLSGICGRLMCCLRFEESSYERELALMPTPDSVVDTPDGRGRVTDVRPVGYTVKVKLDGKDDAPPKTYKLADIKTVVRAAEVSDDGDDDKDENKAGDKTDGN